MIRVILLLLPGLFLSLAGCAKDRSLSPPLDGEEVIVTVKVPEQLKARTMKVMYRSTLCTFTDRTASGIRYQRDGFQKADLHPVRQGQSDLYVAKLPIDGGGACQWRLSNVTFGVTHANPTQFGESVTWGAGGGVVVMFDDNNSPRGGAGIEVNKDLIIKKDYYPWLGEAFLGGYKKRINLAGEGDIYLMYRAVQARQVYFEPILHSEFVLYSVQPKEKKEGNYTRYIYPDGSVSADGRWHPNFLRLQTIRLNAQGK